jgi:hypothetical protein
MGTGSSKVKPDGKHYNLQHARGVLAATVAFRASVDPTARPTARSYSSGPSWREEFQLADCVVPFPRAGATIEISRPLRIGAQVKVKIPAPAGDDILFVTGSVMAFSLLRANAVVRVERSRDGGGGGGGGAGEGGGDGIAASGLPQDSVVLVNLADCEVLVADDQPRVLAGIVTGDGCVQWAGDGTAQRWLRAEEWGVGSPSAGSVVAQLTPRRPATTQPAPSVRVDIARGRVASGIAVGARLLFEMWGRDRRSGTVVAADNDTGKVTVRVDNSDATETFESTAMVPFWCAGGVVAKGARVGFMSSARDDRSQRQVRCGRVMGFKTTGESAEEQVVIRADDDGTEQLFAVHSLVPSSRTEEAAKEGGMAAGEVAVGIVPGTIAVAPLATFVSETAASSDRKVWTVGGSELARDLNEFNFAAGRPSAADFVNLRDNYCKDVTTKRDKKVRGVAAVFIRSTSSLTASTTTTDNNTHNNNGTTATKTTTTAQ